MALPTRIRTVTILGRTVELELPADPEQMLQQAVAAEAGGDQNSDPYWGLLWDAAPKTAEAVLRHDWPQPQSALELGCGIGLAGIGALMSGLNVTFSDLVPEAVDLALRNAARNGLINAAGLVLDWRKPVDRRFPLLLASDVLYDRANHEPLLIVLDAMLADGGTIWIGDAGRHNAPLFLNDARRAGWEIRLQDEHGSPLNRPTHVQFQLIRMCRPSAKGRVAPDSLPA